MRKDKLAAGFKPKLPPPPKQTPVPEGQAMQFEQAKDARPPQEPPLREELPQASPPQGPPSAGRKGSRRRSPSEPGERVTVYLPPDVATELRVRCAQDRRSLSDAITEATEVWLKTPATG